MNAPGHDPSYPTDRSTAALLTPPEGAAAFPSAPTDGQPAPWALSRGATVQPDGVRFELWAPFAKSVAVRVYDDRGGVAVERPLGPLGGDVHGALVPGVAAGADYRFVLDGEREVADPVSRWQPQDVFGPSRVVDPDAFAWHDREWRGVELADLVIYELHVGTFSEAGTFDGVVPQLARLRELGVTAIELMPVAEFPGSRNWGYDGAHLFAPESSYGGPEGLRRLVNAAHAEGLGVLLDVVYNHTGPEGSVLQEYGPYFIDKYKTPWGGGPNTDGPDSDEVRRFIVDNALYWITEYHIDGLRLDATDQIHDFSARHILEELATAMHRQGEALGRRVLAIAETALNDPRWVRPVDRGGFGMDAQWLDDFHHALRTAITPERGGYYGDYAGVASLAKALEDRYVYDGRHSPHWRRRRGQPAHDVPTSRFVAFAQNHDQIGNRARGERLHELTSFPQRKLAAATLLLSPFVPLLFMGEEYGEANPFLYFVSHQSAELVEAVRKGRREEFASFVWEGDIPDPAGEETFARCRLDLARLDQPEHRELHALHRDLLRLRRELPVLRGGATEPAVAHDAEAEWLVIGWPHPETPLLAVLNFAAERREVPLGAVVAGTWRRVLSTDEAAYGGADEAPAVVDVLTPAQAVLVAPAHSATLYRLDD